MSNTTNLLIYFYHRGRIINQAENIVVAMVTRKMARVMGTESCQNGTISENAGLRMIVSMATSKKYYP